MVRPGYFPANRHYPPTAVGNVSGQENQFRIYPNPATNYLVIDALKATTTGASGIKLMNLQGAVIREVSNTKLPYKMDITGLANGLYLLHCTANGVSNMYKLTVQQ